MVTWPSAVVNGGLVVKHLILVFRKRIVLISVGSLSDPTEAFHGLTQSLKANSGVVMQLRQNRFIPRPLSPIIHEPARKPDRFLFSTNLKTSDFLAGPCIMLL
jgi:hypothetical protein